MNFLQWFTLPGIPSDTLTDEQPGIRRIAVDPQQTSFEQNAQFRFFDRLVDIPYGSQIVYKLTITQPINVFQRTLLVWSGGREYLIYKDITGLSFTGSLADSGSITPLNENLASIYETHPLKTVSIQRAVGVGIFTPAANQRPIGGTAAATEGNTTNKPSSEYSPNDTRYGASPQVLWLVLGNIGGNVNTNGHYELIWEQR